MRGFSCGDVVPATRNADACALACNGRRSGAGFLCGEVVPAYRFAHAGYGVVPNCRRRVVRVISGGMSTGRVATSKASVDRAAAADDNILREGTAALEHGRPEEAERITRGVL